MRHRPVSTALALLVGLAGMLVALVLPFAPVTVEQSTVTWPAHGRPVSSSTALFAPYRPAELTAIVPCSAIRAAAGRGRAVTVLATGPAGDGLVLRTEAGTARLLLGRRVVSTTPVAGTAADCRTRVHAGSAATAITIGNTRTITLVGEPVPKVFAFRTDLDPRQAAGMAVTARTASPSTISSTRVKTLLVGVQLLTVLIALGLLSGLRPQTAWGLIARTRQAADDPACSGGRPVGTAGRWWWRTVGVDVGVIGALAGWAVIGPLTDDDGFATTIARNAARSGDVGNYYRWWNASETPFALSEQLLAPLTEVSLAPLWLRLPSTALGVATWFVLSRGVLGAALPAVAGTVGTRLLAAVCLLAAWLPFNLGVRPEPYVALGTTGLLALLWRARGLPALGRAALVAGLTIPVSPAGLLVAAPIVVFAPRIVAIVRGSARGRAEVPARVLLLCCTAAISLTVIFATQTWGGLVAATRWHTFFGPSLPWYHEPDRYRFLLGDDQDGSATKRVPVLLTLALLPVVGALLARRTEPGGADSSAARLAGVVLTALALLWLTPSKWSHHFGAMAGLFASFLVVAVVLLLRRVRAPVADRVSLGVSVVGAALVAAAAGLAFTGPNAWWQPAVYDVPWAAGPVPPMSLPLEWPLLWIGAVVGYAVVGYAVVAAPRSPVSGDASYSSHRHSRVVHSRVGVERALVAAPAVLAVVVAATAVAVLAGSFLAAPLRRPAGSLALVNLHRLTGGPYCGLADDIQVLPDGAVLTRADSSGRLAGFAALAGFDPSSPPPNPPGTGMSTELWGSLVDGPQNTGTMTSPWFRLPTLGSAGGVAVSVSGRTDGGDKLVLEFGRAGPAGVTALGARVPFDRVRPSQDRPNGPPDYRPWRSIGLDAAQVPAGADRVRIHAVDATTEPDGWLAVTGPRLRSVVGLNEFLAGRGPVLVSWPQAFLFPCVRDIVGVAGGLADAPRVVIEAPRRHGRLSAITTDQSQGGDFAALRPFGRLYEVPTRLAGHPEVDWGALELSGDTAARDAYTRTR
ncbi:MAG: arabinosyltransferase domain-containing protein [Pseudonocardiales bacterium]|nr:arabinosyltransferase domain-containing protein [Pseudonocardiales bacterium]MBV9032436.1 arabinosyltransferase domain-containing protein [Pseudonocardiales bacterium]